MYELNIINNIWIASVKGDVNIRLGATKVSAFRLSRVRAVSCGDRHTLVMTSHKPFRYKDDMTLKPYFKILQVRYIVLVRNVPKCMYVCFLMYLLLEFANVNVHDIHMCRNICMHVCMHVCTYPTSSSYFYVL